MPLSPDPRGNSVDTPNLDARPNPQIQTPVAEPIPHPGHTAVAPHPPSDIPHPKSQSTPPGITESAAHELAKLKSQLHALASPDGFAPTRDEFARAIRRTSRPYCKFFKTYDDFIRSCGLRSAVDRRRELAADQRAAQWESQRAAAREPTSTPPTNANSQSTAAHHNSEAPSLWEAVGVGAGSGGSFARAPSCIPLHQSSPFAKGGGGGGVIAQRMRSDDGGGVGGFGIPQASLPQTSNGIRIKPKPTPRTNETFYGDPIHCCDMAHAPVNEQGVVLLFGILAKKLKYRIEMVRTGFPDCEAKRQGLDGKWRRVRIEFEFLSSRFNHDPAGCDLIVCWEDDANPTRLPVLALKNHVGHEEPAEPAETKPSAAKARRVGANRAAPIRNQSRLDQPARKNQNHKEHNRKKPNRQKPGRQKQGRQKQSPRKQERKSSRRHSTRRASAPK